MNCIFCNTRLVRPIGSRSFSCPICKGKDKLPSFIVVPGNDSWWATIGEYTIYNDTIGKIITLYKFSYLSGMEMGMETISKMNGNLDVKTLTAEIIEKYIKNMSVWG